ncbi:hypothetical protein ACFOLF_28455 [Paenibacillus sepulcri]|uniref:Uncharacterized protein n=1 Tax=Paenibacillus sepulcri TaxID=359917 RepID=A0ABS7C151_9BACL|nr:hypothetical protein [Paenibacillus sepulcri]
MNAVKANKIREQLIESAAPLFKQEVSGLKQGQARRSGFAVFCGQSQFLPQKYQKSRSRNLYFLTDI